MQKSLSSLRIVLTLHVQTAVCCCNTQLSLHTFSPCSLQLKHTINDVDMKYSSGLTKPTASPPTHCIDLHHLIQRPGGLTIRALVLGLVDSTSFSQNAARQGKRDDNIYLQPRVWRPPKLNATWQQMTEYSKSVCHCRS